MSRAVIALDRAAAILVGLVAITAGALVVIWWLDLLPWLPQSLDTSPVADTTKQPWWPWAAGLAGVALILLGLWWLARHLPRNRVDNLTLPRSGPGGKLRAAATPVAKAAAEILAGTPGVRSATGRVLRERGQLVARLNATIETDADLQTITTAADQVATDLAQVLERDDLHCQIRLRIGARPRAQPRVS